MTAEVRREGSADGDLADTTRLAAIKDEHSPNVQNSPSLASVRPKSSRSDSISTSASNHASGLDDDVVTAKKEPQEANGHTSPIKQEPKGPAKPAKSSRSAAGKLPPRIAPLFDDLPDATKEATSTFTVIDACTYQNKYLGFSDHALDCDCSEEWGKHDCHFSCR
jgi:histone-lysine N-methyltransferase SETD2